MLAGLAPAWLRGKGHVVWLGAEGGELPEPRPFEGCLGGGNSGTFPRHDDRKRPWLDGAADRCPEQDRLAVDADGDLGGIGVDDNLIGGEHGQPVTVTAADEGDRLPGAVHPDGDHAEHAGVEPVAPARPATSLMSYWPLLTSSACGPSIPMSPA